VSYVGYVIPAFQHFGILFTYVILADLPFSLLGVALAWHYAFLAATWIVVVGSLWWYLLSRLLELGVHKLLRKGASFPGLKL